jgi:alkylation response protein AidB-like acyl-CoA dehydrogenase
MSTETKSYVGSSELLQAVERIKPVIEQFAPQAELDRRLPDAAYDAMIDADLFRMTVPKAYGGLELHPLATYKVWDAVSRIDSAAAWNLVIGSAAICFLPFLPEAASDEVFASGPSVVFAGAASTPVSATPVNGGWRLTGQVPFASGCDRGDWFFVSALITKDAGRALPATDQAALIHAYVPKDDVQVVDTWRTSGMRGTGSGDFVLRDVLVPDHRCATLAPLRNPPTPYRGPLYRVSMWEAFHGETLVSLGAATAAIDKLAELASTKKPARSPVLLRDRAMAQHHIARARALVDAGREYIYASMSEAYAASEHDAEITEEIKIRCQLAACFGAEASVQAIDLVHEAAGTSAIRDEFGIERHFRDIHALSQHANKSYMRYESVGKLLFGLATDWFVLNL